MKGKIALYILKETKLVYMESYSTPPFPPSFSSNDNHPSIPQRYENQHNQNPLRYPVHHLTYAV